MVLLLPAPSLHLIMLKVCLFPGPEWQYWKVKILYSWRNQTPERKAVRGKIHWFLLGSKPENCDESDGLQSSLPNLELWDLKMYILSLFLCNFTNALLTIYTLSFAVGRRGMKTKTKQEQQNTLPLLLRPKKLFLKSIARLKVRPWGLSEMMEQLFIF